MQNTSKKMYQAPVIAELSSHLTQAAKSNNASENANPSPGNPGMGPS